MRRALTCLLFAAGCGDGAVEGIVEFAPPPGFDRGTQLLTVHDDEASTSYVLDPQQTFDAIVAPPGATIDTLLFDAPLSLLMLRPGPIDAGALVLPAPRSRFTARLGDDVSPWEQATPVEPPSVAFDCPTFAIERVDLGRPIDEALVGVVAMGDGSALLADHSHVFEWRDDTIRLVSTTTHAIDRLVVDRTPFVGLDRRYVARLVDAEAFRLADVHRIGGLVDDVAANDDATGAYAVASNGTVARFADGAWTTADPMTTAEARERLVWVGDDEVIGVARQAEVARWRGGRRTTEPIEPAVVRPVVTGGVVTRGQPLLLAKSTLTLPLVLAFDDGVWKQTFVYRSLLFDIRLAVAHPNGFFYAGARGRIGFTQLPSTAPTTCAFGPLTSASIDSMTFIPPDRLLVVTGDPSVWMVEVLP